MSDKHNIDDLFKSKLQGREVGYSAAAWAGAEGMLGKHYKLMFIKKLMLFLVPTVIVSGVGLALLLSTDEPVDVTAEETTSQVEMTSVQNAATNSADQTSAINASKDEASVALTQASSDADTKNASDLTETAEAPIETKAHSSTSNNAVAASSITENPSTSDNDVKSLDKQSNGTNELSVADEQPANKATAGTDDDRRRTTDHSVSMPPGFGGFLDDMDLEMGSDPDPAPESAQNGMVNMEVASLRLSNHLDPMTQFEINLSKANSGTLLEPNRFGEPTMKQLRKIQLFGEFGVLAANGFHDLQKNRMAPAFGGHAQVLAMYHVSQSLHFDLGVGAFNRGSLTKNTPFTGNAVGSQIDITPVTATYASLFVGFGHRVGARHSIGGGMQLNPLIAVIAKEEKSMVGESSSTKYIKDKNGFQAFDAAVVVNYRLSISERWDATAAVQIGFLDATDDAVFKSGDVNDFNTLGKVGLSYRLTNR